ncbi:hypothetical protein [Variovorax sp. J22R115]|uniref:hypothetical protein n=1 Tax=Variovorax sp. J22R115 TaxID=3053509 RepID=UPI002576B0D0|nr:hypothetical protein [Variovorax sp. J22R115]MDM0049856.1 hypothetical protein [Variovorax sp. J22R115]
MSNDDIRPTTLVGIKRLAKAIKSAQGIPHHQALDEAARRANLQNFRHASGLLRSVRPAALALSGAC